MSVTKECSLYFQPYSDFRFGMDAMKCSVLSHSLKINSCQVVFCLFL